MRRNLILLVVLLALLAPVVLWVAANITEIGRIVGFGSESASLTAKKSGEVERAAPAEQKYSPACLVLADGL